MMLIHPSKMIVMMTKAMPFVVTRLLSLFDVAVAIMHLPPTHLPIIQMTNLVIVLTLVNNVMPVLNTFTTPVISAKTPVQSNGMIAR